MKYLPFQGISYIPSMIFTNGFSQSHLMVALLQQLIWVIILLIPIQLLWIVAKRTADYSRGLTKCFMWESFFNTLVNI